MKSSLSFLVTKGVGVLVFPVLSKSTNVRSRFLGTALISHESSHGGVLWGSSYHEDISMT
jgi:hypothetical protein